MGGVAAAVCAWPSDTKVNTSAVHIHNFVMMSSRFQNNTLRTWRTPVVVHSSAGCQRGHPMTSTPVNNVMAEIIARAKQRAGIA